MKTKEKLQIKKRKKEKLDSLYDRNTWVKTNNRQQMFRLSESDFKITNN